MDNLNEEQKPSITLEEMDSLIDERFAMKEKVAVKEAEKKELNKELARLEGKIVACLKEHGRRTYATDTGSVYLPETPLYSVTMPKELDDKMLLFGWMKEKHIYDKYCTVNAASLKSLFNAERQAAEDRGEDMMVWNIPGLGDAKLYEKLNGRKK